MRGLGAATRIGDLSEQVEQLVRVDPRRALTLADRAVALAQDLGDAEMGIALRARAHALRLLSRYGEALAAYDDAIAAFERAGSVLEAARTAVGKVDAATNLGRLDEARAEAQRARAILARGGDSLAVAKLDLNLGIIAFQQDALRPALTSFRRAQRAFARLGDDLHVAAAGADIGLVLTYLNRFGPARWHLARARRQYVRLGQPLMVAALDLNLGYVASCQGDHLRALDHLLRARADYERQGIRADMATTDLDIAQSYLALRMLPEAAAICREAASIFEREGMAREWAQALVHGADAVTDTDPRAAVALLQRARRVFEASSSRVWCALIDLRLAQPSLSDGGDGAGLNPAIATLAELGLERRCVEGRLIGAERAERSGQLSAAQTLYTGALASARRLGIGELRFRAAHGLARLQHSLPLYRAAADELEAMRLALGSSGLQRALGGIAVNFYAEMADLLVQQNAPRHEVFHALEAARAGALPAALAQRSRQRAAVNLAALREEVAAAQMRLRAAELGGESGEIARLQREAAGKEERLLAAIRGQGVRSAARAGRGVAGEPAAGLDEVQARLRPGQTLVEYLILPTGVLALVVTAGETRVHRLGVTLEAISGLCAKLRFAFNTCARRGEAWTHQQGEPLVAIARHYLRELHALVVEPLQLRPVDRLVVVPAGPLHGIPFGALFDGSAYLGDRCDVLVAPSATLWSRAQAPEGRAGRPLVMGLADEYAPLAEGEARAIAGALRTRPYLGSRATRAAFLRRAPEAGLIHLAAHASVRADNPEFSAIHFADGPLAVHDLAGLRLRARLTVLSACATGVGPVRGGEAIESLGHAFLAAGVQSLIVSLWPVSDRASTILMGVLHDALGKGAAPAAALREAQRATRAIYPHPYYWAPFVAAGGWTAEDQGPPSQMGEAGVH